MCNKDNWGNILLIRTGSKNFNMKFLAGLARNNYCHEGGYIRNLSDNNKNECFTEEQAFQYAGMDWVSLGSRN